MRPIKETISLDEARTIVGNAMAPIERVERVALADANGRVVGRPVVSSSDVPPFARAAMDGFAVVAEDTFGASTLDARELQCIETVFTGQVPSRTLGHGQCTEIATGAPIPEGASAVVMVEDTDKNADGAVHIFGPVYPGQNVTRQGADIRSGQQVLSIGDVLTPSRIGSIAALGFESVDVFAQATDRDSLDRQRGRRSRAPPRAGPDLRHQQVHAGRDHPGARRRAGAPPHRRR